MVAVLTVAGGSLEPATIVTVFADRLPHALDPTEDFLTEAAANIADGAEGDDPAQVLADREQVDQAVQRARDFYWEMSADERRLLPYLYGAIGEQMKVTGRGKSQTYLRVSALKQRLKALLGREDDEDDQLTLGELLRMCSAPVDAPPDSRDDLASIPVSPTMPTTMPRTVA
jgi:hypothetical protein